MGGLKEAVQMSSQNVFPKKMSSQNLFPKTQNLTLCTEQG